MQPDQRARVARQAAEVRILSVDRAWRIIAVSTIVLLLLLLFRPQKRHSNLEHAGVVAAASTVDVSRRW